MLGARLFGSVCQEPRNGHSGVFIYTEIPHEDPFLAIDWQYIGTLCDVALIAPAFK